MVDKYNTTSRWVFPMVLAPILNSFMILALHIRQVHSPTLGKCISIDIVARIHIGFISLPEEKGYSATPSATIQKSIGCSTDNNFHKLRCEAFGYVVFQGPF